MKNLQLRKQFTTALAFNASGTRLAVGGKVRVPPGRNSGRVDVWSLVDEVPTVQFPTLADHVVKLGFLPNDALVVIGPNRIMVSTPVDASCLRTIQEWPVDSYRVVTLLPGTSRCVVQAVRSLCMFDAQLPKEEIWRSAACVNNLSISGTVAASSIGGRLAVSGERTVEIRDIDTGNRLSLLEIPNPDNRFLGFRLVWSPNDRWIAENSGQWVNIWDSHSGRHVFQIHFDYPGELIRFADFHKPTGKFIVVSDFQSRIFEPESWEQLSAMALPNGLHNTFAADDSGQLAMGGDHGVTLRDANWLS